MGKNVSWHAVPGVQTQLDEARSSWHVEPAGHSPCPHRGNVAVVHGVGMVVVVVPVAQAQVTPFETQT
jgi:hypothetical protein